MKDKFDAIYIPSTGAPSIVTISLSDNDICKTLETDVTDHVTPYWLEKYGYCCCIFCKDMADDMSEINALASKIGQEDILGNCLIVDDNKDLTIDDLKNIIKITESIDFVAMKKEEEELCIKNMQKMGMKITMEDIKKWDNFLEETR